MACETLKCDLDPSSSTSTPINYIFETHLPLKVLIARTTGTASFPATWAHLLKAFTLFDIVRNFAADASCVSRDTGEGIGH